MRPESIAPTLNQVATGVCVALFVLALAAAPHSCDGGLEAYFWSGVATAVVLGALPFLRRFKSASRSAGLRSLLHVGLVCGVWLAGLFAGNFQIMCRLF